MDKNTVLEAILFMERTLRADGLNVDKMILFGSHARAAATKESDIDVAIISVWLCLLLKLKDSD